MPSFKSLGLDVRADVSMLLVTFLVTLGVLGILHGEQGCLRAYTAQLLTCSPVASVQQTVAVCTSSGATSCAQSGCRGANAV